MSDGSKTSNKPDIKLFVEEFKKRFPRGSLARLYGEVVVVKGCWNTTIEVDVGSNQALEIPCEFVADPSVFEKQGIDLSTLRLPKLPHRVFGCRHGVIPVRRPDPDWGRCYRILEQCLEDFSSKYTSGTLMLKDGKEVVSVYSYGTTSIDADGDSMPAMRLMYMVVADEETLSETCPCIENTGLPEFPTNVYSCEFGGVPVSLRQMGSFVRALKNPSS